MPARTGKTRKVSQGKQIKAKHLRDLLKVCRGQFVGITRILVTVDCVNEAINHLNRDISASNTIAQFRPGRSLILFHAAGGR